MSTPKTFFAAKRWIVLHVLTGLGALALGGVAIGGGGWTVWLGWVQVASAPFYFWLAWRLQRHPVIDVQDGVLRQHAVGSRHQIVDSLDELGPLKWATRSNLCFEARTKKYQVVSVFLLSRQQRRAILDLLTGQPVEAAD